MNILIVDDILIQGEALKDRLDAFDKTTFGIENVMYCQFPDEALELLKTQNRIFDVVFLDYEFNFEDTIYKTGVQLGREIKRCYPHLLLVAMTAYYDEYDKNREIASSQIFADYLPKGNARTDEYLTEALIKLQEKLEKRKEEQKYNEDSLMPTKVRLECIEKAIEIYKKKKKLQEKEDIEQAYLNNSINFFEDKLQFKTTQILNRKGRISDNFPRNVLESIRNGDYSTATIKSTSTNSSNPLSVFLSNNKLKVRQILLETENCKEIWKNTLEHCKFIKDIVEEYGLKDILT